MVSEELRHTVVAHHKQSMTIPEVAKMLKLQQVSGDRGCEGPAVKWEASNGKNPGAEIGRQQENQEKSTEKPEKTHPRAQS